MSNEPLLPTGQVEEGGWLTSFACRIVVTVRGRTLRSAAKRDDSPVSVRSILGRHSQKVHLRFTTRRHRQ